MKEDLKEEIIIPEGIQVKYENENMLIKGPKGEVSRKIFHPSIKISIKEKEINVECKNATKREKTLMNSMIAHIKNMITGVQELFTYKLKICAGPPNSHFPVQVIIKDSIFSIKNFLGEKVPRELKIKENVKVELKGEEITVQSPDIEAAGRTASELELLTKVSRRDRRIFQDGIYIIEKP